MGIGPIKKIMVHSAAAEMIQQYIKENDLKAGDRLPSERSLAEMLSIGRNSLREALRTLETMNVLEVVNGKGIFVKDGQVENPIDLKINVDKINLLEILDIRRVLEGYAIELVVKNAKDEDIKNIEEKFLKIKKAQETGINPFEEDREFHEAIYHACGNKALINIMCSISQTLEKVRRPFGEYELFMETMPLHQPLLEAIKKRSKREALKAFRKIIDIERKKIIEYRGKEKQ